MFAATAYKLFKNYNNITTENLGILIIGNIIAFLVAIFAIKSFIYYLTKHGFKVFGYYRIFVGFIIILLSVLGIELNIV